MKIQTCEDIDENQGKALLNDKLRRFMETSGIYTYTHKHRHPVINICVYMFINIQTLCLYICVCYMKYCVSILIVSYS